MSLVRFSDVRTAIVCGDFDDDLTELALLVRERIQVVRANPCPACQAVGFPECHGPHLAGGLLSKAPPWNIPDIDELYTIARDVTHQAGMPWTDPRTGVTEYPPVDIRRGTHITWDRDGNRIVTQDGVRRQSE